VKQPFAVILSLSRKIMSKSFLKKFFETAQIMVGLAVMMAVERGIKKIFVHFLRFGCQI
jgi:hypothetical protein